MATTPFMSLLLPTPSVTPGPDYASELNAALTSLDGHNHTSGFGALVPSAGLNINADLSFGNMNATNLRSARFYAQGAPLNGANDVGCLYISGGNLYYNNGAGQQIQLTAGAALNAASIGAIGGDYSTSTASEFFTSATSTFSFWSAANKSANLDCGNVVVHEPGVTSSKGITLKSPASLANNYNITLPGALPAATKIVTLSSTGVTAVTLDAAAPTFTGAVTCAGLTSSGNAIVAGADLSSYRAGGTTGVIYLNQAATRYLYFDGTNYQMPSGQLQGLSDPTAANAAATKNYVDGLKPQMAKAWATLTCGSSGAVTVTSGYNVASASWSTNTLTVNFSSALANTTYAPVANAALTGCVIYPISTTTTSFQLVQFYTTNAAGTNFVIGEVVYVIVFGS